MHFLLLIIISHHWIANTNLAYNKIQKKGKKNKKNALTRTTRNQMPFNE